MSDQTGRAAQLLRYLHELSDGQAEQIIRRKGLGARLGLTPGETREALALLAQRGLIRPILFGSLCLTRAGVIEALQQVGGKPGPLEQGSAGVDSSGTPPRTEALVTILFVSADPSDVARLRLGEEAREVAEKLQLAKLRDRFRLEQRSAVRPADLSQALLDVEPNIVHFSGHGTSAGALCLEDRNSRVQPVAPEALAALFAQFAERIECVLLNACFSEIQAEAIARHVRYVIGMRTAIGDRAAIAFAVGFYQGLGAGKSVPQAYELGRVQIQLQGIPEHLTPSLIRRGQVDDPAGEESTP